MGKQLSLWKMTRREAGYKGYLVTTDRIGKAYFHHLGGETTARMDLFTCGCHGVGITAYAAHWPLKGKRHRY